MPSWRKFVESLDIKNPDKKRKILESAARLDKLEKEKHDLQNKLDALKRTKKI